MVYCLLAVALLGFLKAYSYYYKKANQPEPETKITKKLNGTLKLGPLYYSLKELDFTEAEIANITNALKRAVDPQILNKNDSFFISMSVKGKFQRLVITHGFKRYYVAKIKGDKYISGEIKLKILESRKFAAGTIENSLWSAMVSENITPQIIMEFSDVFVWNIDFLTEVRPGDKYAIVWDEKSTQDGQIIDQKIIAAYYQGSETDIKEGFLWDGEYYDLKGEALEKMFLRAPLSYRRISSHFSRNRFHPILRIYRAHNGTDYVAPRGTPVSCVARGKIVSAGRKSQIGNYVRVKHDFGYTTIYGHLNSFAKATKKGSKVKQGQVIGYVGATGTATAPHLHFAIQGNGKYFNFVKFKNRSAKGLAKSKLPAFKQVANELNAAMDTALKQTDGKIQLLKAQNTKKSDDA